MVISIDWLQLHLRGSIRRQFPLVFKKHDYSTQTFKSVEDIYYGNDYVASLVSEPFSSVLHPRTCILKIINKVLYSPTLFFTVDFILESLSLEYVGITRIDLCADFNTFKNGLHPESLINSFMCMNFRKIGQSKGKCHFEQKQEMHYETLKFGTGNSLICSYLYNKTKELNDVKMKPYIIDMWKASGLDVQKDVWRLEFSVKGNSLHLLDELSGELSHVDLNSIRNKEFLHKLFYSLQYQYFRFKRKSADKNVSRWPDVDLLSSSVNHAKRMFITQAGDVSRADRIFLKKLDKMNDEIRNYANYRKDFMTELVAEVCVTKGLSDYYLKKIGGQASKTIKYLQNEETTMYNELKNKTIENAKENELFHEDDLNLNINKIVLQTKRI